ncbi:MAG TPA: TIR domain-containing protein [Herpetosiphonaceae bacterium]
MAAHHFISYSSVDAQEFALELADKLVGGDPSFTIWLDKRELQAGDAWDQQIVEAIRDCESLIFVMTPDSVAENSVCKQEWTRALRYKKPVIPVLLDPQAEMPFRLEPRQHIDFTESFDRGLAKLRSRLKEFGTPRGKLRALTDRLADAERDLRRAADPVQQSRIREEIALLKQDIDRQRKLVEEPEKVAKRTKIDIERQLDRERFPEQQVIRQTANQTKIINLPPGVAPDYFQGRHAETQRIGSFLRDDASRLLTVIGRGGVGKTTMVCRVLKALESGHLPNDGGALDVDGIIYLSMIGSRQVNLHNLFTDLSKLLPEDVAAPLEAFYRNPRISTEVKMAQLLDHFTTGRTVVLLDNLENLIDAETQRITDTELDEALYALLKLPPHTVKVIVTSRIAPRALTLFEPGRQTPLPLDEGLPAPYAENLLRRRDADGKVGLRDAPDELLGRARERTQGYPRALEALFAILAADRDTSLHEILDDTTNLLPENVIEALVGEAFSRLDPTAQQVMQALAVYNRPVTPNAVDSMLQPYVANIKSDTVLKRLVNMQFARKQSERYYLHPVDRKYAFDRIPRGEVEDRSARGAPRYTQFALLHRGAEYFKQARKPEKNWKTLADLEPQLAEFELRYAGEDYEVAAGVLLVIDYHLGLWGQNRLIVELHERLLDNLSDYRLVQFSTDSLGRGYLALGQYDPAIACHQRSLSLAVAHKDKSGEGLSLGSIGVYWFEQGQPIRAMKHLKEALNIALETKDQHAILTRLMRLGACYKEVGQTARAMDHYEQALGITRKLRAEEGESIILSNIGLSNGDLGQTDQAVAYFKRAQAIAQRIGAHVLEGTILVNQAIVEIDLERHNEAMEYAVESAKIANEISNPRLASYSYRFLALARFYMGDLVGARESAETALLHNSPEHNHNVMALLGVIALHQGERETAREKFNAALQEANRLLRHTPELYKALDTKALALCGLALIEGAQHVPAAIEAYRAARAINSDAGIVGRVLRLFDALASQDAAGVLADVRPAAGEVPASD